MKTLVSFLSLAVFCFLSTATYSQTTFTGAISTDWSIAGNWSNGLPALVNEATIPAGLTVVNNDIINNFVIINNNGIIDNNGFIFNYSTINIDNGGLINNNGFISNRSNFEDNGFIYNGFINNSGFINNNGFIENSWLIDNNGLIDNNELIENNGLIDNNELIENNGLIFNHGAIFNYSTINQCGLWIEVPPHLNSYTTENCPVLGCTDTTACNYDDTATMDDGSCFGIPEGFCDCEGNVFDECGVCGGTGIPDGACDCDGNMLDTLGVCGGTCAADADADGICDDVDDCIGGELDECGVCNGLGAIYECGCPDIVTDALGICGGDCISDYNLNGICDSNEITGCTYEEASNFNANATLDDGSCVYEDCDITSNDQAVYDAGVASVECPDITSNDQAVYDGAFADGVASVPENICPADLNIDGVVNAADLLECLGSFGASCE